MLSPVGKIPSQCHSSLSVSLIPPLFGTAGSENLAARDEDSPVPFRWHSAREVEMISDAKYVAFLQFPTFTSHHSDLMVEKIL